MPEQPFVCIDNQRWAMRLPRSLSAIETWGFGLTGHVGWIGTATTIHAALGAKAILVWLPGVIVSVLLVLQVQRLGSHWSDMAGGTHKVASRLLPHSNLGRYVAIAYFIGWASTPAVYAMVLTDLITANLAPLGITCPEVILKIGFGAIAFLVVSSGSRALAILHLFFLIPAIALLIAFCFQGISTLAISPPHFISTLPNLDLGVWSKWFLFSTYTVYSTETGVGFVADSKKPDATLRFLSVAAWLTPVVFLGGSMVLTYLDPQPDRDSTFLNLLTASQHFWGQSAPFLLTVLISYSCLLNCATAVSIAPRILYQLALDKQLNPIFTFVSRQGVLEPALLVTFLSSVLFCAVGKFIPNCNGGGDCLLCIYYGNTSRVVDVSR